MRASNTLHAEVTIIYNTSQAPDLSRSHTDEELAAVRAPFDADDVARLAADRERHGGDGARMLACGWLAHYSALVLAAYHDAAEAAVKGGAP